MATWLPKSEKAPASVAASLGSDGRPPKKNRNNEMKILILVARDRWQLKLKRNSTVYEFW